MGTPPADLLGMACRTKGNVFLWDPRQACRTSGVWMVPGPIPTSPAFAFDPEWETNGLLAEAMDLLHQWVARQSVPGMTSAWVAPFRPWETIPLFLGGLVV